MDSFEQFGKQRVYTIPLNQRGFSWTPSHLGDVIQDLSLAAARQKTHYLGPLILSTLPGNLIEDNQNVNLMCVLEDGQQRVTSFFIMISALRKRLLDLDGGESLESVELERLICYVKGQESHLRITNENDQLDACLKHLIMGQPAYPANETAPMKCMKAAVEWAYSWASRMNRDECVHWKNSLSNRAKFILVDLAAQQVDRYLTFDAINSRGLPLSQFDKIKNFCILADDVVGLKACPEGRWYEALQELERYGVGARASEETFINELVNVFHNLKVVRSDTHTRFVDLYRPLLDKRDSVLESNLEAFISLWPEYARSFAFITSKKRHTYYGTMCTGMAGKWLDRLNNMDYPDVVRPVLVSSHLTMKPDDFERLARVCEVYTFRVHGAMGARSNTNTSGVLGLANEVLQNSKDIDHVSSVVCEWLRRMAPMRAVLERLADGTPKYAFDPNTKGWKHCYYFLYEYELGVSPQGTQPLPYAEDDEAKKNTQEHILPQQHRDGAWWESHWPDAAAADRYKHRLGNLVLTSGNQVLGRKAFALKCNDPNANYSYTSDRATNAEKKIPQYSTGGQTWLQEQIIQREYDMLVFATKRWSIPCCADNDTYYLPEAFSRWGLDSIVVSVPDCVLSLSELQAVVEDEGDFDDDNGMAG